MRVPFGCRNGHIPRSRNHLARVGRLARASALLLMHERRLAFKAGGSKSPQVDEHIGRFEFDLAALLRVEIFALAFVNHEVFQRLACFPVLADSVPEVHWLPRWLGRFQSTRQSIRQIKRREQYEIHQSLSMTLESYATAFTKLRVNTARSNSPHKPCMLLAVLNVRCDGRPSIHGHAAHGSGDISQCCASAYEYRCTATGWRLIGPWRGVRR